MRENMKQKHEPDEVGPGRVTSEGRKLMQTVPKRLLGVHALQQFSFAVLCHQLAFELSTKASSFKCPEYLPPKSHHDAIRYST